MDPCDPSALCAYLDDELPPRARGRVEDHLRHCLRCAGELEDLRRTVALVAGIDGEDVTPEELARAHEAIEQACGASVRRVIWTVGTIAASVLVIAASWFAELPDPIRAAHPGLATGPPPAWEQAAVTLRVEPISADSGDPTRLADGTFAHWMADSLFSGVRDAKSAD